MSGGHFNYEDARALETVIGVLAEDIDRHENAPDHYGNDEPDIEHVKKIKQLLAASQILKEWLHDYDWQCSGDVSNFDQGTEKAISKLTNISES